MVLKMKEKVDQKLQVIEVGQTTEEATNNDRVITTQKEKIISK